MDDRIQVLIRAAGAEQTISAFIPKDEEDRVQYLVEQGGVVELETQHGQPYLLNMRHVLSVEFAP